LITRPTRSERRHEIQRERVDQLELVVEVVLEPQDHPTALV
jgi:hypothetical protein